MSNTNVTRLSGVVEKGWGHEEIFVTNNLYCGKFLHFKRDGEFSMHFHREKTETWYVQCGEFDLTIINTEDASISKRILSAGDVWTNHPLVPHKVKCLKTGTILEISTPDSVEDNYRVMKGDSQRNKNENYL